VNLLAHQQLHVLEHVFVWTQLQENIAAVNAEEAEWLKMMSRARVPR